MNKMSLYRVTKMQNRDKLVVIKNGVFYNAYMEDAYILWYVFKYKVIDKKASFPDSKLDSVIKALNSLGISVVVVYGEGEVVTYYGDGEMYEEFLRESGVQYDVESKIDDIMLLVHTKIKKNKDSYDKIMEFLNNL